MKHAPCLSYIQFYPTNIFAFVQHSPLNYTTFLPRMTIGLLVSCSSAACAAWTMSFCFDCQITTYSTGLDRTTFVQPTKLSVTTSGPLFANWILFQQNFHCNIFETLLPHRFSTQCPHPLPLRNCLGGADPEPSPRNIQPLRLSTAPRLVILISFCSHVYTMYQTIGIKSYVVSVFVVFERVNRRQKSLNLLISLGPVAAGRLLHFTDIFCAMWASPFVAILDQQCFTSIKQAVELADVTSFFEPRLCNISFFFLFSLFQTTLVPFLSLSFLVPFRFFSLSSILIFSFSFINKQKARGKLQKKTCKQTHSQDQNFGSQQRTLPTTLLIKN